MRRSLSFFVLLFSTLSFASSPIIPSDLLDPKKRGDYLSHADWLGISFPVSEIVKIKKQIEDLTGEKFFGLSDSYLMVITSQEWSVLKTVLKMSDVEKVFLQHKINSLKLRPHCLARVEGKVGEATYSQWALILKDQREFANFRRDLRMIFRIRGGVEDDFHIERWKPLLVIGFSSQEYFDQSSLVKSNELKCVYKY